MKKQNNIIIAVLVILQIFTFFNIRKLKKELKNYKILNGGNIEYILNRMDSLYDLNYREDTEKGRIKNGEIKFGQIDEENLRIDLTYEISLNEYKDDMEIYLKTDTQKIPMVGEDGRYLANINASIFETIVSDVLIKEGDIISVDENYSIRYISLKDKLFPAMDLSFEGNILESNGKYKVDGFLVGYHNSNLDYINYENVEYVIELDGNDYIRKEISFEELYSGLKIKEKIDTDEFEIGEVKLILKDSLGLKHEYFVKEFGHGRSKERKMEKIYSEDGNLLWESES